MPSQVVNGIEIGRRRQHQIQAVVVVPQLPCIAVFNGRFGGFGLFVQKRQPIYDLRESPTPKLKWRNNLPVLVLVGPRARNVEAERAAALG